MTQKSLRWRLPLIAALVAMCLYYAIPPFDPDGPGPKEGKIKLGLDLQGGMDLVLRVDTEKVPEDDREDATLRAMEIIRNRIDQFGVAEPQIQQQGFGRIGIQLPGVTDRQRALDLIGKTALLEFKLVLEDAESLKKALAGETVPGYILAPDEDGKEILVQAEPPLTGKHITNALVDFGRFNEPIVTFEFDSEGGKIFSDLTGSHVGEKLAIVLDDVVQSSPVINERIPMGRGQITGRFNFEEASDLAIALRAGALPAPIIVEEERSVGASLGRDSVEQGIRATLIGFGVVVVFMAAYYLFAGVVANFALFFNILIILAALSYFRATLTLPGIAGIVLTIGMAVDTNVLIFERIREELALKKPIAASVMAGYKKAFVTIFDANLTTLITAFILYNVGSGPVRGFALTLGIGILASMFTGIFCTRALFDAFLYKGALKSLPMMHFFSKTPSINFLKVRRICYVLSIALILFGMFSFWKRGAGMYGVDFSGGSMQEYAFEKPLAVEDMRRSLTELGMGNAVIQRVGDTNQLIVRSDLGSEEAIAEKIRSDYPGNPYDVLRIESVGPVIGKELKKKALWALLLSVLAICAYVGFRFDFKFAVGAILALFHDALVAVGCVAMSGREFSIPVLAAVLTILGYSINDTIVIFDRIREHRRTGVRETLEQGINTSLNQTLSRTILTSLTVVMVVVPLYFFGGEVINDFAFTMIIGVIAGTYSSIYIAAPVLVEWAGTKQRR